MIKSIRDHKRISSTLLALSIGLLQGNQELTLPDLEPASVEKARLFLQEKPGEKLTIHIVPETDWLTRTTAFFTARFDALRNRFSVKQIGLTVISGALSLGWISYLLCTYIIYKTYGVIKSVHSWANWCSDDELLSDYELLYRKCNRTVLKKQTQRKKDLTLQQEKQLIGIYLRLDAFLRKHHIRHHFPHAQATTQKAMWHAYERLELASKLYTVSPRGIENLREKESII